MMRGEPEIALTTPVSLTAFQPSLGRIISLTVPGISCLATITGPYGTKPDRPWAVLFDHFMV
jgi:hypothetical protein